MNDLRRLHERYQSEIEQEVLSTLRSGWWLNGNMGAGFAADFARSIGVTDCILVANGTDALEIALAAVDQLTQPTARDVLLVANAGGYASGACWRNAFVPHFVDIEQHTQLMDISATLAAVSTSTAAIVVTHLYGNVVDVAALKSELTAAGLGHIPIIEDCAQAHGAHLNGKMAGSVGDIATFSFYPTKNLGAMGDGGAVATSDPAIAMRVRQLQQYGWGSKYHIETPNGRNSRMDEVQAAVLGSLLPHLESRNEQRRAIVRRYSEATRRRIRLIMSNDGSVAHLAVCLCDDRDDFRSFMKGRGIDTDIHYPVLDCDQIGWAALPMKGTDNLPVSRSSVGLLCSIPCYPDMTPTEVDRVCAALAEWESK